MNEIAGALGRVEGGSDLGAPEAAWWNWSRNRTAPSPVTIPSTSARIEKEKRFSLRLLLSSMASSPVRCPRTSARLLFMMFSRRTVPGNQSPGGAALGSLPWPLRFLATPSSGLRHCWPLGQGASCPPEECSLDRSSSARSLFSYAPNLDSLQVTGLANPSKIISQHDIISYSVSRVAVPRFLAEKLAGTMALDFDDRRATIDDDERYVYGRTGN